ncbi:MAG TPA: hypothetical protein RMH99_29515 [Sandaracinaceae bacterium LLY-WYZ-13_1]|nr:hypothetical protein [Sandaracinaceae bacterium LLY-WYZ-13_1]
MRRASIGLVAALCVVSGCDEGAEPTSAAPEAPSEAAPEASEACRAAAARIEAAFARPEDPPLFRGVDPAPLSGEGGALDGALPKLVVSEEAIALDEVEVRTDDPASVLAAEMGMHATLWGSAHPERAWPNATLLYVPNGTRVARLAEALSALPDEMRFDLVVQDAEPQEVERPNPPPWLRVELARLADEPSMAARRARFRALFERAAGDCREARAHAPHLFGPNPEADPRTTPDGTLREAFESCGCAGADVEALVAIGILTGPPNRHPLGVISFRRVEASGEGVIEVDGSHPVEHLIARLEASEPPRRVRLSTDAP